MLKQRLEEVRFQEMQTRRTSTEARIAILTNDPPQSKRFSRRTQNVTFYLSAFLFQGFAALCQSNARRMLRGKMDVFKKMPCWDRLYSNQKSATSGFLRDSRYLVLIFVLDTSFEEGIELATKKRKNPQFSEVWILEGCGWAVNQRMCLTRKLRRQFTERRAYPDNAAGTPQKRSKRFLLVLLFIILAVLIARGTWSVLG